MSSTPKGREEFEKCVTDAESFKPGTGALLREIWHRDKDDFLKDQGKNDKIYHFVVMISQIKLLFGSHLS